MRAAMGLSAAVLVATTLGVAFAQSDAGSTDSGRELFVGYQCWQCHGTEAQGGAGPRIAGTVYPFEAFARLVRHTNQMPAYSPNVLSDDELRAIWEFVRSQSEPPAVDDIPEMGAR